MAHIIPYLNAQDAGVRGHAAWVLGILSAENARSSLCRLKDDENFLEIYENSALIKYRVKDLVEGALKRINPGG